MTQANCPQCGNPIRSDLPGGLCPVCVMAAARNPINDPDATEATDTSLESIPSIVELSAAFPELEIIELIGRGGMGAVFKARQKSLNRLVALKIFLVRSHDDAQFHARFEREAHTMAKLNHPSIVSVFDFGQRDRFHFLLMEYIDGLNLRQITSGTRLSPEYALQLVPQLCDALQYAHGEGVVHRDIKPENVLIDQTGLIKIADFGLAKLTGPRATTSLTQTQQVMGTLNYMAPEQREHPTEVDHRADIYSLGVVIYELLTGELPLGRFQPPSRKVEVDARLDEVVMKALAREPELRFQNASEFKTGIANATNDEKEVYPVKPAKPAIPATPAAPTKQYKEPTHGASIPVSFQEGFLGPVRNRRIVMQLYTMAATVVCMGCGLIFILGSSSADVIPSETSKIAGIMTALFGGYLFAVRIFVSRLLNVRPDEPDQQKEYDKTTWIGAVVKMVAMAFGFSCGALFIMRAMLDVHERYFFIAAITCAITSGILFSISGMIEEIFNGVDREE